MTIKTRNRLNIILSILSFIYFLFSLSFFMVKFFKGTLSLEPFTSFIKEDTFFLFRYNPYCVIAGLLIQILFVTVNSYILYHGFEKTQGTDIVYFTFLLLGILADTARLWIVLLNLTKTYTALYLFCGHACIFGKILVTLSLFAIIQLSSQDLRMDTEKNLLILFLASFFFAKFIPLNSAVVTPNFSVSYSYGTIIAVMAVLIMIICVISLFFQNKKRFYNQKTTVGFALICIGVFLIYHPTNLFLLAAFLGVNYTGSYLFLKTLHDQYLWND